jgi:hypothetical protein
MHAPIAEELLLEALHLELGQNVGRGPRAGLHGAVQVALQVDGRVPIPGSPRSVGR